MGTPPPSKTKVWPWVVLSVAAAGGLYYLSKHSRPAPGLYDTLHSGRHARAA